MTVKKTIERATMAVPIRKIMIRNMYMKKLVYFGSPDDIPSQLLNKEVQCYLYNPTRQLFIMKI